MNRKALEAAFRLASTLPSRIHEQHSRADGSGRYQDKGMPVNRITRGYILRLPHQKGPAGIPRPVRVGKHVYSSITEAKTKLKISPKKLYHWLDIGQATYEDRKDMK
jgi:hypothetical protein